MVSPSCATLIFRFARGFHPTSTRYTADRRPRNRHRRAHERSRARHCTVFDPSLDDISELRRRFESSSDLLRHRNERILNNSVPGLPHPLFLAPGRSLLQSAGDLPRHPSLRCGPGLNSSKAHQPEGAAQKQPTPFFALPAKDSEAELVCSRKGSRKIGPARSREPFAPFLGAGSMKSFRPNPLAADFEAGDQVRRSRPAVLQKVRSI
jgi:hypothetical protein